MTRIDASRPVTTFGNRLRFVAWAVVAPLVLLVPLAVLVAGLWGIGAILQ